MKKLLILLLISMCAIAWRSEPILHRLQSFSTNKASPEVSVRAMLVAPDAQKPRGMSLHEYAELAKTDPDAYRKLMQSHLVEEQRSEVDKLMNLLARGRYE
jgi:hypothetical protein